MQIPPSCTLDEAAMREQKARYVRIAQTVTSVRREPDALEIAFDDRLDINALERVIEVERDCCPFFRFSFEPLERRLTVTVDDPATRQALEAIEQGFASDDG